MPKKPSTPTCAKESRVSKARRWTPNKSWPTGNPEDYDVEAIQDAVIKSDTTEGGRHVFYIEDDYDAFWEAVTDNIK